ncbi:uncharacterized protein CEXT_419561 [Caerostris extrusa]|uniref:Uncharacterized protein n=1 Tax=Caerostris extrusa TaxID=172846 RepID=A0AAV4QA88_CAEEX|nr:uncharacterized protein CEXT_419561 [Caerostris extrusa]
MIYPSITNVVTFLFSTLCLRCSYHINHLTKKIAACPPESFGLSKQLDVLRSKAKINEMMYRIEDVFSFPTFFIILANVLLSSSVIGWFLLQNWASSHVSLKIKSTFQLVSAFLSTTAILWVAGGLAIEDSKFKEMFHRKIHLRMLYCGTTKEKDLGRNLSEEPSFALTGCNILPYRRSMILAVFGTLFTYTVLIMNS